MLPQNACGAIVEWWLQAHRISAVVSATASGGKSAGSAGAPWKVWDPCGVIGGGATAPADLLSGSQWKVGASRRVVGGRPVESGGVAASRSTTLLAIALVTASVDSSERAMTSATVLAAASVTVFAGNLVMTRTCYGVSLVTAEVSASVTPLATALVSRW